MIKLYKLMLWAQNRYNHCQIKTSTGKSKINSIKPKTHLQFLINGVGLRHIPNMNIETKRGEKRHEEDLGRVRVRNPNGLPGGRPIGITWIPVAEERRHHPVLHAVLFAEAVVPPPGGDVLSRDRSGVGEVGVHQADVKTRRQIVHVDTEGRRSGGARRRIGQLGDEVEELGFVIEGSGE